MRILYILNHVAVCKSEPLFMAELGHEVYLPKLWPYNTRSGGAFDEYDQTLTLPDEVKAYLDQQDLYKDWSVQTTYLVNAYFDIVVVACFPELITQAIRKFRGPVVLRSFGGSITGYCVGTAISSAFGEGGLHLMRRNLDRIHYLQAFDVLQDYEPEWLRPRAFTVQATMEDSFWQSEAETYRPSGNQVLMVMPDIRAGDRLSYRAYHRVRQHFKDLDWIVLGKQDQPVSDPRVLGYIQDADYSAYLHEARVMFYHNDVPHHLHYHPVEAACIGTPVIFLNEGYLGWLTGQQAAAGCADYAEAKKKIQRILTGDTDFIAQVLDEQKQWCALFRPERCRAQMRAFLDQVRVAHEDKVAVSQVYGTEKNLTFFAQRKDACARQHLEQTFDWLRENYPRASVTLALSDNAYNADEVSELKNAGLPVTQFRLRTIHHDEAIVLTQMSGVAGGHFNAYLSKGMKCVIPRSDGGDFMNQDLWWVDADLLRYPWLPLVPMQMFVHDPSFESADNIDVPSMMKLAAAASNGVYVTNSFARNALINIGLSLDFYDLADVLRKPYPVLKSLQSASPERGDGPKKLLVLLPASNAKERYQEIVATRCGDAFDPVFVSEDELAAFAINKAGFHAIWVPQPKPAYLVFAWKNHHTADAWWLPDSNTGQRFAAALGLNSGQHMQWPVAGLCFDVRSRPDLIRQQGRAW